MAISIPIQFPSEAEKIYREAVEFRKLSSEARIMAILDLMASGMALLEASPHREFARQWRESQEELWRKAHRELFAKHGF